jgi:hypothetical protein
MKSIPSGLRRKAPIASAWRKAFETLSGASARSWSLAQRGGNGLFTSQMRRTKPSVGSFAITSNDVSDRLPSGTTLPLRQRVRARTREGTSSASLWQARAAKHRIPAHDLAYQPILDRRSGRAD